MTYRCFSARISSNNFYLRSWWRHFPKFILHSKNRIWYDGVILKSKHNLPSTMRTQNRYAYGYAGNQAASDARRIVQEKIEVNKRLKSQQSEKYLNKGVRNVSPEELGNLPSSARAENADKPYNQRYFRKERPDPRIKASNSQEGK